MTDQPAKRTLQPPSRWFEDRLLRGKCLVMLDGLDEVPDETQRRQVSQWVDSQIRTYPENVWILSSRPFGYQNAQLKEARTTLGVLSFNLGQMKQFLNRWYLQNEILRQARKPDPGVKADAARKATDLITRIQNYPPLAAMALNPLLLTMIATVHDNRGALPGSRVELYDEICDVLLVRRQEAKGLQDPLTLKAANLKTAQKRSVLQTLALVLMLRETREFNLKTGSEIVGDALKAVAGDTISPDVFLKHIENVCGLLVEREKDSYQFAHLSFQEYLAAAQLKETQQTNCLVDHMENSWWHETIRLYAADNDTTELVKAAIEHPSVGSLMIAYDCLDEGKSLAPEVRQRLDAMGAMDADPAMAKLSAEVKLARRLTRLLRIDDTTQIDQGYVTQAEFQLFLRETGQPAIGFQPSEAYQPVVGINLEQALQFCRWLSGWDKGEKLSPDQETTGQAYYRLPTMAEADQIKPDGHGQLNAWNIGHRTIAEKGLRLAKEQVAPRKLDLYEALAAADWPVADQVTNRLLLDLIGNAAEKNGIQTLPCQELAAIDRLWFHCSDGKFGFGTQASIWEAFAFDPSQQAQHFADQVSWSQQPGQIQSTKRLSLGHFPAACYLEHHGPRDNILQAMMERVIACGFDRSISLTGFEVVTVNDQGAIEQRTLHTAQYFVETLEQETLLQMVAIPGGTFMMGSPDSEEGRESVEGPQHEVTVAPFWMSQSPITQAQWRAVAALPKVNLELKSAPSKFRGNQRPVEQISWEEAVEFCDRISHHTNRAYRLPTEAEWEYACRAGTTTPFFFGPTLTAELANYDAHIEYGQGPTGKYRKKTTDVGSFPPNAFGLYDMHGNVWEWCQDDWHNSYEGAPTDGSEWLISGESKVLRGGSWNFIPRNCRSALRLFIYPVDRYDYIGFRVVCSAPRILP